MGDRGLGGTEARWRGSTIAVSRRISQSISRSSPVAVSCLFANACDAPATNQNAKRFELRPMLPKASMWLEVECSLPPTHGVLR